MWHVLRWWAWVLDVFIILPSGIELGSVWVTPMSSGSNCHWSLQSILVSSVDDFLYQRIKYRWVLSFLVETISSFTVLLGWSADIDIIFQSTDNEHAIIKKVHLAGVARIEIMILVFHWVFNIENRVNAKVFKRVVTYASSIILYKIFNDQHMSMQLYRSSHNYQHHKSRVPY